MRRLRSRRLRTTAMRSREKFARYTERFARALRDSVGGQRSAGRGSPEGAWPQVPEGFKVDQFATGLENPRIITRAPNGDIFVAETKPGDIRISVE